MHTSGSLLEAVVLLYLLSGIAAGFVAARLARARFTATLALFSPPTRPMDTAATIP